MRGIYLKYSNSADKTLERIKLQIQKLNEDGIESLISKLPDEWKGPGQTYLKIVKARAELLGQYNYIPPQELPNDVLKAFIDKYYEEQKQADKLIDYLKTVC